MYQVMTSDVIIWAFAITQVLYLMTFMIEVYLYTLPIDFVDVSKAAEVEPADYPFIVLFYPVLRELEQTMETTFSTIRQLDYPADKYRVIAIPNANDDPTVASLQRLRAKFPFLEIIEIPATTDASWDLVWKAWDDNDHAYWWHKGPRAHVRDLPPKKTRQLIYAFYHMAETLRARGISDFLVNYIDADSCPPPDHFKGAVAGLQHFDVLQSQNIAGNLLSTMASSWHAFDHMTWDGAKYPHLSAGGNQPYWMLGKGLFFRASDLLRLGSFHPWITIEDPEVGMRFWKNGLKLGILQNPLIEEVPETFHHGITQRKRWICGFFQSLGDPLTQMGFTRLEKMKAWLNFLPCLTLWLNVLGLPVGIWALWVWFEHGDVLPPWLTVLAAINTGLFTIFLANLYVRTWRRSAMVLGRRRDRLLYLLRINPLFLMAWWLIWLIPLWIGFRMYRQDDGLVWDRTVKIDANHALIATKTGTS